MERLILKEFGRRFYDYFPYEWHWDCGYVSDKRAGNYGSEYTWLYRDFQWENGVNA